jgi:hypothetical protein
MTATPSSSLLSVFTSNGIGVFEKTGNDYFIPTGNVGIGIAPSPGFKLDVIGDARISNNLFVGGGIVITDKVQAATQVKGWDVKVDNDLNVTGASSFTGTANFKGNLIASNGVDLGNSFGMKSGVVDANGNNFLQVGKSFGGSLLPAPPICPNSASNMWWMSNYGGYISQASGGSMNASLSMWTDWINGTGHIEAQGTNNSGTANTLLINYYCGRDVGISNGPNGGNVRLAGGTNNVVTIGSPANIRTFNGDALRIENPNNNNTTFYVATDGRTIISSSNSDAFEIRDPNNSNKVNFKVKTNGETYSRFVRVSVQNFPDYVFAQGYKLPKLEDVELYYQTNKHLPEIPSASEVENSGLDLGEMNKLLLKKVEELTIYLVEQNKTVETQKLKLKEIENKLNKLNN